jgi:hypothetical protein
MSDRKMFESLRCHRILTSCSQFVVIVIRISHVMELTYDDSDSADVGGYTSLKGKRESCGRVLTIPRRDQNCVVHVRRAEK